MFWSRKAGNIPSVALLQNMVESAPGEIPRRRGGGYLYFILIMIFLFIYNLVMYVRKRLYFFTLTPAFLFHSYLHICITGTPDRGFSFLLGAVHPINQNP